MYELTIGDERYIEESLTIWKMYINPVLSSLNESAEEFELKISGLEKQYVEEFYNYFSKKKEEDESLHADEIKALFDEVWSKELEEFYDMDKLFMGLDEENLKNAKAAIDEAKKAFQL